jgi:hypothetical protein
MYFFLSSSPFNNPQTLKNNEETTRRLLKQRGVALPPEGSQHFLSHLNEMNVIAISDAFKAFNGKAGVHEITITSDCAVTRLQGPKMGQENLSDEERTLHSRGEGRPPQPVVIRPAPFQYTDAITLVIFPNEAGKLVLWTMHSGPAMDPDFSHEDWSANALAFTPEEVNHVV